MRNRLLLILLLIAGQTTFAQEKTSFSNNLWLRVDGHYGFVIPEYKHFNLLVNKPTQALEVSLFKRTTGKTDWEQLYKYPELVCFPSCNRLLFANRGFNSPINLDLV